VLGDRGDNRLVIGSGVDRCQPVEPNGETLSHIGRELAVLSCVVQALEEGELLGIGGVGLVERRELLHDDVRVTLDLATAV
jgi:hypothetical protein